MTDFADQIESTFRRSAIWVAAMASPKLLRARPREPVDAPAGATLQGDFVAIAARQADEFILPQRDAANATQATATLKPEAI